jgi:hypothetical protein
MRDNSSIYLANGIILMAVTFVFFTMTLIFNSDSSSKVLLYSFIVGGCGIGVLALLFITLYLIQRPPDELSIV